MASSFETLNDGADGSGEKSVRRRKIDRSQWPELLARRDAGASQAQIAHEYGVSQGTISQILKRARAEREAGSRPGTAADAPEGEVDASEAEAEAPRAAAGETATGPEAGPGAGAPATASGPSSTPGAAGQPTAGGGPSAASAGAPRSTTRLTARSSRSATAGTGDGSDAGGATGGALQSARPAQTAHSASTGRDTTEQDQENPLARRLRDATERCAALVERGGAGEETLGEAVHEVRRALAAVEIETAKRSSPARHASRPASPDSSPPPQSQQAQSAARSFAAEPPRSEPSRGDSMRGDAMRGDAMRGDPLRSEPPRPEPGYGDTRAPGMHTGRIKFFKPDKGFGFIIPDGGGEDVFLGKDTVAAAGLDRLSQGDRVAYEPGPGNKGIEAKSIRLAS